MALTQEEIALLTDGPLFRYVDGALLQSLEEAEGCDRIRFEPGQVVYSPQQFRRSLGVVLAGQLQVTKGALVIRALEPGDLFGAAALYSDAEEFAGTVTARRSSVCLLLGQQLVDRLIAEQGQIRENYLRYLTGRIQFLSGRLQTLAQPGVEGKLARYLLAAGTGTVTCSATELCRRLGVSRASLYRAFSTLENSGRIVREGKAITIVDPPGLEMLL